MPVTPAAASTSAFTLDERLLKADSLVLVFYKDPYGPDSLRYTRYYTQSSVVNGLDIFKGQLSMEYSQQELRKCRTEGKIWCFTEGKIFQTIYFSTKCQKCCFTYLIKDGSFYYSAIDPAFTEWLSVQKLKAIELPNNAIGGDQ